VFEHLYSTCAAFPAACQRPNGPSLLQYIKQVCVDSLVSSAVDMTLPVVPAERRAAAAPLLLGAGVCYRSISPARGALSSKPAAVAVARCDRRTDGQTDAFVDPAVHTVQAVSVNRPAL